MIINYRFADGETSQVEVSDEIGVFIIESRREEERTEKRMRRHCWSIDALEYEGLEYGVNDIVFKDEAHKEELKRIERIHRLYSSLTETQRRRLKLYASGKTYKEIAELEGVSLFTVRDSIELVFKKFNIFLNRHPKK